MKTRWVAICASILLAACGGAEKSNSNPIDIDVDATANAGQTPCTADAECDDVNPCTDDVCSAEGFCAHTPGTTLKCDDGNLCTVADVCSAGKCVGTPVVCDDGNLCTVGTCDPTSGACKYHADNGVLCDDGDLCTTGDVCQAGTCAGKPIVCNDGDACNGVETCDVASGACLPGTALICDDHNPCTDDVCDPATGCANTANTDPCDDGNACTAGDVCMDKVCTSGTPIVCEDGDACNGEETCDSESGCVAGTPIVCDDGNACNGIETCDSESGACVPGEPVLCDDGDLCTYDICSAGICGHEPVVCDDNTPSTADSCDPVEGCIFEEIEGWCESNADCAGFPAVGTCNSSNSIAYYWAPICLDHLCQVDEETTPEIQACLFGCNADKSGCFVFVEEPSPCDGVICDDGNACTDDWCEDGVCFYALSATAACDDGNPTTTDSCDPALGCVHSPIGCSGSFGVCMLDGNLELVSGQVICSTDIGGSNDQSGSELCDGLDNDCDGEVDEGGVCPLCLGDAECDDGNACNGVETCDPAVGCMAGTTLVCDDGNPSTTDTCDPDTGCVFTEVCSTLPTLLVGYTPHGIVGPLISEEGEPIEVDGPWEDYSPGAEVKWCGDNVYEGNMQEMPNGIGADWLIGNKQGILPCTSNDDAYFWLELEDVFEDPDEVIALGCEPRCNAKGFTNLFCPSPLSLYDKL